MGVIVPHTKLEYWKGFKEYTPNPFTEILTSALISSLGRLGLDNRNLEDQIRAMLDFDGGHPLAQWPDNYVALSNILELVNLGTRPIKIIDIGCGAPYTINELYGSFLPYKAEILTHLGAKVVGIDYRKNPLAGYNHQVLDFMEPDGWKRVLEEDYDLVIATMLDNGGVVSPKIGKTLDREENNGLICQLIRTCLRPNQMLFLDDLNDSGKAKLKSMGLTRLHTDASLSIYMAPPHSSS